MSAIRRIVLLLAALVVSGFVAFVFADRPVHERQSGAGYRAPAANPPADPNRPDLFEEPRIDE